MVVQLVDEAVASCFGADLLPRMKQVCVYLLASVVYHHNFLKETLQPNHPVWASPLFNPPGPNGLMARLAPHVALKLDGETKQLRATGVPPHVHTMRIQAKMLDNQAKIIANQEALLKQIDRVLVRCSFPISSFPE